MAEYRVVAKLEAQTGAGTQKVKQDLRSVQTEAKTTERALGKAFDQAGLDRSIAGLISRVEQLDKSIGGMSASNATLTRSNETLGQSLDRMAASFVKAKGAGDGLGKGTDDNAKKQASLEAALRRVLLATDSQAAEQQRLNLLVSDAKRLRDAQLITEEQFLRVQKMATDATVQQTQRTGSQRIGLQQLGFQLGDVATMYSLGAKPAQIFASQIGQITQAVMLMSDGTSKVAAFLGGPWGIALSIGLIALSPFVGKLFESNDALGENLDKLRKDARESEAAARAKEVFSHSLDGLIKAIHEENEELKKSQTSTRQSELDSYAAAAAKRAEAVAIRDKTKAALEDRRAILQANVVRATRGGPQNEAAALGLGRQQAQIADLDAQIERANKGIAEAEELQRRSEVAINQRAIAESLDASAAATGKYERAMDRLIQQRARNEISQRRFIELSRQEEVARDRAIKQAQEADRLASKKPGSDGVSRFRSAQQAIGIAGRELQRDGLRVSENAQFGGVKGRHTGAGHRNGTAIDVNQGAGIVEANVPDIRAKFDQMALRYQARGYTVLWNGKRYPAGGGAPTPITGADKHYDHMHLEAPGTIVGKATQASTEAQYQREESEQQRKAKADAKILGDFKDDAYSGIRDLFGGGLAAVGSYATDASDELARKINELRTRLEEARELTRNIPGVDPSTGISFQDQAAKADEQDRYLRETSDLESHRAELLAMGVNYDALVEAARQEHYRRMAALDAARKDQQLNSAQDIAGSLTQIAADTVGKQSAIYKTLFAIEKAVAIARAVVAIQTGVAQAAALPFPANLPAIASVVAATASIVSNISAVALNFADGGMVRGPGGPRDDKVRANLSNGEFVVNADATARNRELLEAVNAGRPVRPTRAVLAGPDAIRPLSVRVDTTEYPGATAEVEYVTRDEARIMIKKGVASDAPKVFTGQLADRNSRVSKGIYRETTARPKMR